MTQKTKLMLKCDDKLWTRIQYFKIKHQCKNMNETVTKILEIGLGDGYNAN